jgi:release factor glutamine methyltransferase
MSKYKSLGSWLSHARQVIKEEIEQPGLVSEVLAAHHLQQPRTWVLAHPEYLLEEETESQMDTSLRRLLDGAALPYILGKWDFFGLSFKVSPATLIPRPETEQLVEIALEWLKQYPGKRCAADVGTGSGCIAVSLAAHVHDLCVIASDISLCTLQVAVENIHYYTLQSRIHVMVGDLLEASDTQFDLICANLPYIPTERLGQLQVSKNEPLLALDGGKDGTGIVSSLIKDAANKLSGGGLLLMEIDERHAQQLSDLASCHFPSGKIEIIEDLAGKPRILRIEN